MNKEVKDYSNKVIASLLYRYERMVCNYLKNLFHKTGSTSLADRPDYD